MVAPRPRVDLMSTDPHWLTRVCVDGETADGFTDFCAFFARLFFIKKKKDFFGEKVVVTIV